MLTNLTQRFRSYDTETFNVRSHFLGAVWFSLSSYAASCRGAPGVLFLSTSAFCFWCSTVFHMSSSHPRAAVWQFLDHVGIVAIIWSSATSFVLIFFAHRGVLRIGYISSLSVAAALCLIRLYCVQFHLSQKRRGRIVAHICYGALAMLPALHCCGQSSRKPVLLRSFCLLVATNSLGGGVYATNLLERTTALPSGASHNFMHVAAILGACIYQHGLTSDSGSDRQQRINPFLDRMFDGLYV